MSGHRARIQSSPVVPHARPALSIALALLAAGCGSRSSGGTSRGAALASAASTATAVPTGPKPRPPVLDYVSSKHPGIGISWVEPTPCDTVEGERHDVIEPYPSQATPPRPPHFSVPGGTLRYLDTAPTESVFYTYHVRCKVQGVPSDWSNEFAANPAR